MIEAYESVDWTQIAPGNLHTAHKRHIAEVDVQIEVERLRRRGVCRADVKLPPHVQ